MKLSDLDWWNSDKPYQFGDWITRLREFPDEVIDCLVTSPPYWNLRDYEIKGQLGLEDSFEDYIQHLCDGFDEVKRVMKKTGTCWVNIGDSHSLSGGRGSGEYMEGHTQFGKAVKHTGQSVPHRVKDYPAKSLVMIPFRFAIEMVNRGWRLRNVIIWKKPACMPSSAKDRFTIDFEYIFFFTKSQKTVYWINIQTKQLVTEKPPGIHGKEDIDWYWTKHKKCNGKGCKAKKCIKGKMKRSHWEGKDYYFEQQLEPHKWEHVGESRTGEKSKNKGSISEPVKGKGNSTGSFRSFGAGGRNKRAVWKIDNFENDFFKFILQRLSKDNPEMLQELFEEFFGEKMSSVWDINPASYKGAHFAVYPEKLIETPIKAGCPEQVCKKCGMPREKVYEYFQFGDGENGYNTKYKEDYGQPIQGIHRDNSFANERFNSKEEAKKLYPNDKKKQKEYVSFIHDHRLSNNRVFKGWSECGCNAGYDPGIVIDPFVGSGTTMKVSRLLNRFCLGIDLNPKYGPLIEKRGMVNLKSLEEYF